MNRIDADWLDATGTQAVLGMLHDGGYLAYAVGGCVRNALLGIPVSDVDIATNASPETVVALAAKSGLHSVPTGIDHGTITVVADGVGFEVTTFRKDVETDGRRAIVHFADTVKEDAIRRDFTINALYCDRTGQIFDPLGGMADIAAKQVRFINDPEDRIREDYLRILRFFRFFAWFADQQEGFDPDGLAACAALADGVETLSKERVGHEVRKLLLAPDPAMALAIMGQSGVLGRLLPGVDPAGLALMVHVEEMHRIAPSWIRRLAAIGPADAKELLRLSRADDRQLHLLIKGVSSTEKIAALAYKHGAIAAIDIALLRAALLQTPVPENLQNDAEAAAEQVFPVTAADLMPDLQGAALGAELKRLETLWISSDFQMNKNQLLS